MKMNAVKPRREGAATRIGERGNHSIDLTEGHFLRFAPENLVLRRGWRDRHDVRHHRLAAGVRELRENDPSPCVDSLRQPLKPADQTIGIDADLPRRALTALLHVTMPGYQQSSTASCQVGV